MISIGEHNVTLDNILSKVTEFDILNYYFGITKLPIVIKSPLRPDKTPSFGIYSNDGVRVYYIDFSTKDRGGLFDLLMKYWGESYGTVLKHIWEDLPNFSNANCSLHEKFKINRTKHSNSIIECKIREWKDYDIEYWNSYGVSLNWLKWAEVYPISHKIVVKNGIRYSFKADKYAYVYVEHKEGKVTIKLYQPYNKSGYKWCSKHDKSVISLWTKIPEYGDRVCICSSLKDALCLSCQTGIPALAIQGEGYSISNTAINELKRRYKNIYILFDNDEAGLKDGRELSESTGFINIILPKINNTKDISDLYKSLNDSYKFKEIILDLFKN